MPRPVDNARTISRRHRDGDLPGHKIILSLLGVAVNTIEIKPNVSISMSDAWGHREYSTYDPAPAPGEDWTSYKMQPKLFLEYNENNWLGESYGYTGSCGSGPVWPEQSITPPGNAKIS